MYVGVTVTFLHGVTVAQSGSGATVLDSVGIGCSFSMLIAQFCTI